MAEDTLLGPEALVAALADRSLILVDDDDPFRERLARALERRGFQVAALPSVAAGVASARERPPAFAVVDRHIGVVSVTDTQVLRAERF